MNTFDIKSESGSDLEQANEIAYNGDIPMMYCDVL